MREVDFRSGGSMLFAPVLYAIVARYQRLIICSAVARLYFDFLCASIIVVTVEKWLFEPFVVTGSGSGRTGSEECPIGCG